MGITHRRAVWYRARPQWDLRGVGTVARLFGILEIVEASSYSVPRRPYLHHKKTDIPVASPNYQEGTYSTSRYSNQLSRRSAVVAAY